MLNALKLGLVFVFFILLASGTFAAQLRSEIVVAEDFVTLGDLVTDAGSNSNKAIFRSPRPGTTGFVKAEDVALAAYRAGLSVVDLAGVKTVSIRRVNNAINRESIGRLLTFAIAGKSGDALSSIRLGVQDLPSSARHDAGGMRPQIDGLSIDTDRDRVSAILVTHTKRGAVRTPLYANLVFEDDALVLRDGLKRGDLIKRADLTNMRLPRKMLRNAIFDPEQLVGMQMQRDANSGIVLRSRDVRAPTLVARNREVLVTVRRGGLALTARGKAMENGALGDTIEVINTRSQKVLQGTVQRDGSVLVGLTGFANPSNIRQAKSRRAKRDLLRADIETTPLRGARVLGQGNRS